MASTSFTPSTQKWTYDVFLSFRGEDTRKTFVGHLHNQLDMKGIYTFIDGERLEKGKCISPSLLRAIQESRFAIIVFSKNYASSTWCLDEVATIMECKEKLHQIVVPIFYDVDPSQVRKQTGSFSESFAEHEENFKDDKAKVERWRKALTEASNITGHDLQSHKYNGRYLSTIPEHVLSARMTLEQTQSWKIEEFAYWKATRRVEQFARRIEHLQISARGLNHCSTFRDYTKTASEIAQRIEQNARHVESCLEAIRNFDFRLDYYPLINTHPSSFSKFSSPYSPLSRLETLTQRM